MKRLWSIAAAAALALFASTLIALPAAAATATESEPNGSRATADSLALNTTFSGSTRTSNSDDDDYFAVQIPSAGRVKLNLTFASNLGTDSAYEVIVYNSSGTRLYDFDVDGGDWNGTWLASQGIYLPAGKAYIRIYGNQWKETWGTTYKLTVGWTAGTVEREPNNSTAAATTLALGSTLSGSALSSDSDDDDYFAVQIPSAGRVKLNLTFASNLGTDSAYEVIVYNSSGTRLYDFDVDGGDWNGTWLASQGIYLPAGKAYIRIYGNQWKETWGTTYKLTVGWTAGTVEREPNNSTAAATTLALGSTLSGSALSSDSDDDDYFAVQIPSAGRVKLNLTFASNLGTDSAYEVIVYNSSGTRLYDFDVDGGDWNGTWLASQGIYLPAGKAYIRIYGNQWKETWGTTYRLNVGYRWSATATPTISGTAKVGKTLTAKTGTWSPTPTSLTYTWYRSGTVISGATKSKYTLVAADKGKTIKVKVTAKRSGYPTTSKTSKSTAKVAAGTFSAPTPKISGTAKVGKTLTAKTGTWSPKPSSLTYRWYRSGKAISGATKSKYTLVAADKGKTIKVKVTGKKSGFTTLSKTSKSTGKVAVGTFSAPIPTISGKTKVGKTLTAKTGTWSPKPSSLTYRWYRSGKAISGATKSKYTLVAADKGKTIKVKVTGKKSGFTTLSKTSKSTAKIGAGVFSAATPTISGTAKVGMTLTAHAGTWSPKPTTLRYQWYRSGVAIGGATSATYTLTSADVGQIMSVKVTGKRTAYTTLSRTSVATATVASGTFSAATPTISGTPKVGHLLTASKGTWSPAPATVKYQWYRSGYAISGATSSTYRLVSADRGKTLRVHVVGSKAGYTTLDKASAATSTITG